MTLRSSDLQSDSDLDSIRNSCDVLYNSWPQLLFLDRSNDVQVLGVQEAVLYSKATLQSLQMVRCRVLRHLRFAITSNIYLSAQFELRLLPHQVCFSKSNIFQTNMKTNIKFCPQEGDTGFAILTQIQDIHIHIQDHIQDSPISRMRWSGRQTSSGSSGSSFWKSERLFTFLNCLLQPLF